MSNELRRRKFFIGGLAALTAAGVAGAVTLGEYTDLPGFDSGPQAGRTKNAIAAVTAAIVGQQMYGSSTIDLTVQKHLFPDTRVTGTTTPHSVDTLVDVATTSSHFTAQNEAGYLVGNVKKSEFDWKIKQTADGIYDIARWGPKFDSTLKLKVADGKIMGTYVRPGPHFDWDISGTYDADGNVSYEVDGPMNMGITLVGTITQN